MAAQTRFRNVDEPIDPKSDGLRILATRFRGRGMPADRYDVWMPSLGPSEELLKGYLAGAMSWRDFARAFERELFEDGPIDERCATIKNHGQKFTLRLIRELAGRGPVTLLCHCEDVAGQCHLAVLRKVLAGSKL